MPDSPIPRSFFGYTLYTDIVAIFGGKCSDEKNPNKEYQSDEMWLLNLSTNKWSKINPDSVTQRILS